MRASPTSLPTRSSRWTPSTTATPSSFPSERFPSRRTQCYESFFGLRLGFSVIARVFIVIRYPALFYVAGMHLKICLFCAKKLPRAAEVRLQAAQNGNTPGGNEAVKERRRMRIAKHILYRCRSVCERNEQTYFCRDGTQYRRLNLSQAGIKHYLSSEWPNAANHTDQLAKIC